MTTDSRNQEVLTLETPCGCTAQVGVSEGMSIDFKGGILATCKHGKTVGFTRNSRQAKRQYPRRS
jgi:hypothetical protein